VGVPERGQPCDDDRALHRHLADLRVSLEQVMRLQASGRARDALLEERVLHQLRRVVVRGDLVQDESQSLAEVVWTEELS